jgi:hypothetical protein
VSSASQRGASALPSASPATFDRDRSEQAATLERDRSEPAAPEDESAARGASARPRGRLRRRRLSPSSRCAVDVRVSGTAPRRRRRGRGAPSVRRRAPAHRGFALVAQAVDYGVTHRSRTVIFHRTQTGVGADLPDPTTVPFNLRAPQTINVLFTDTARTDAAYIHPLFRVFLPRTERDADR